MRPIAAVPSPFLPLVVALGLFSTGSVSYMFLPATRQLFVDPDIFSSDASLTPRGFHLADFLGANKRILDGEAPPATIFNLIGPKERRAPAAERSFGEESQWLKAMDNLRKPRFG